MVRTVYGRKYNAAFLDGLTQDPVPITIRAIGARLLNQIISINHFFEREEK